MSKQFERQSGKVTVFDVSKDYAEVALESAVSVAFFVLTDSIGGSNKNRLQNLFWRC